MKMSNKKLSIIIVGIGSFLTLIVFVVLVVLERYTESILSLVLGNTTTLASSLIAILSNANTENKGGEINDNRTTKINNRNRKRTSTNKSKINNKETNE